MLADFLVSAAEGRREHTAKLQIGDNVGYLDLPRHEASKRRVSGDDDGLLRGGMVGSPRRVLMS